MNLTGGFDCEKTLDRYIFSGKASPDVSLSSDMLPVSQKKTMKQRLPLRNDVFTASRALFLLHPS